MPDTYVDVQWWGHGGTEGGLRGSEWLEGKSLPKGISIILFKEIHLHHQHLFLAIMEFFQLLLDVKRSEFLFSVDEIARRKRSFFLKIFANQQKLITFRTFNINMTLFVRTLNFLFPNKPFDTSSILFLIAITKR